MYNSVHARAFIQSPNSRTRATDDDGPKHTSHTEHSRPATINGNDDDATTLVHSRAAEQRTTLQAATHSAACSAIAVRSSHGETRGTGRWYYSVDRRRIARLVTIVLRVYFHRFVCLCGALW